MRFMNAYLVREDDGFTLVDTMAAARHERAASPPPRRRAAPIRRIALTHGHGDHVGSLDALRERLGDDVEVLMPERDARILAGDRSSTRQAPPGGWPKVATTPGRPARRPATASAASRSSPAPATRPGHVAFLDMRDRALIAGDAFTRLRRHDGRRRF